MNTLDTMLDETLQGEDRRIWNETQELGWFELSLAQFTGTLGWVTWVIMVTQVTLFALGLWCAIAFFQATEVLAALKWGISGAVLWIMAINLKLSLMPKMQADRVIRELRRIELMMAARQK